MDINSGHLINTDDMSQSQLKRLARQGYEEVPKELSDSAKLELMGKKEVRVGLKSTGKLSKWAKKKREGRKKLAMAGK